MARQDLATQAAAADPLRGLKAVVALHKLADRLEALQVQNARNHGWTWLQIGEVLGVSKQAVHKRYRWMDDSKEA